MSNHQEQEQKDVKRYRSEYWVLVSFMLVGLFTAYVMYSNSIRDDHIVQGSRHFLSD